MKLIPRALVGLVGFALLVAVALPATAGAEGRRNTALALGALSLFELSEGNYDSGAILGLGSAVAWDRYFDARYPYRYAYARPYYPPPVVYVPVPPYRPYPRVYRYAPPPAVIVTERHRRHPYAVARGHYRDPYRYYRY